MYKISVTVLISVLLFSLASAGDECDAGDAEFDSGSYQYRHWDGGFNYT
ncbi:hypothetical protein [Klebsiella oxytoca]|nr:hypothetical protein [Klebsiella oxytoca]MDM4093026.1 hypothetical protein [Klebsiella oxytoca]